MVLSIADFLKQATERYPEREALIFQKQRFSYRELNQRVNAITHALLNMGVKQGDRVSVLMDDCSQYLELYFAAAKGNFILNPINFRLTENEIAYIVGNAEPTALIVGSNYRHMVDQFLCGKQKIRNVVVIGGRERGIDYEYLVEKNRKDEPNVPCAIDDPFCLMYTSGTTGFPKGALLTNCNFVQSAINMSTDFEVRDADVCLHVTPIFHAAVGMPLCHVVKGCKNILMSKFDPEVFLKTVEDERVTFTFLVATMLNAILNVPGIEKYNLRSIRTIGIGAAPVPVERLKEGIKVFGNVFIQTYGLTEGTCVESFMDLKREFNTDAGDQKKLASIGKGVANLQTKIVNDAGNSIRPGEIGELIFKGKTVMKEYWRNPEETNKTLKDGWLYTGDLATVDSSGWIYIVDRKKDMIISGGENIYPKEVENVLYRYPGINEVAVIGVPDEKWGESVKALVSLRKGMTVTEEELIDFCKKYLASYKKPKSVEFLEALKKTASGKIDKRAMRALYWAGRGKKI